LCSLYLVFQLVYALRCVVFALSIIIHNCTISRLLWRFDGRLQRRHSENFLQATGITKNHLKRQKSCIFPLSKHTTSPITATTTTTNTQVPELHSGLFDLVQQLEPSSPPAFSALVPNPLPIPPIRTCQIRLTRTGALSTDSLGTSRGLSPLSKTHHRSLFGSTA
jgi:hypothetical protein